MTSPRAFGCPACGAEPGSPCVRPSGHAVFGGGFHAARRYAADRAGRPARRRTVTTRVVAPEDLEEIVEVGLARDWPCGCKLWHAYGRLANGDYEGGLPIHEWCPAHDPEPPQPVLFAYPK